MDRLVTFRPERSKRSFIPSLFGEIPLGMPHKIPSTIKVWVLLHPAAEVTVTINSIGNTGLETVAAYSATLNVFSPEDTKLPSVLRHSKEAVFISKEPFKGEASSI